MSTIIEQAVRQKLRFNSTKGVLSVEQLFDLPFTSKSGCDLQTVATDCDNAVKSLGETDFVGIASKPNATAQLRLDVVKHVIAVLKEERNKTSSANAKKVQKEKLLHLLAQKENEELSNKSPEELQAMIDAL
jgi:hypothetical protein